MCWPGCLSLQKDTFRFDPYHVSTPKRTTRKFWTQKYRTESRLIKQYKKTKYYQSFPSAWDTIIEEDSGDYSPGVYLNGVS